jgi:hypothetical protein
MRAVPLLDSKTAGIPIAASGEAVSFWAFS